MRITPHKLSEIAGRKVEAVRSEHVEATEAAAGQPTAGIQPDQVTLSPQAIQIQRAHQALANVPEVRQEKVAEARQKIAEGTLQIDPEAIAAKIITGGI